MLAVPVYGRNHPRTLCPVQSRGMLEAGDVRIPLLPPPATPVRNFSSVGISARFTAFPAAAPARNSWGYCPSPTTANPSPIST